MALWTPANAVVKPLIWFDAKDASKITAGTGAGILNLGNKGTNGLDAYQTNASLQPQLIANGLNGNPVIEFNGTNYFQFAQTQSLIDKTFIILWDNTGAGINFLGDAPQRFQVSTAFNFFATGYPSSNPTASKSIGAGWGLGQADHHATLNYFFNGVIDPVTQTRSYAAVANFSNFGRSISQNWTARMAAFLMLPSPLSEDERQRYEGWLLHEWGLNTLLLPGHPYYNTRPVTEIVVPVRIPNAPDGARYRIWNSTRNAEIENTLVSGGTGISTTFIADDDSVPHVENDSIVVDVTYPANTTAYKPSRVLGQAKTSGVSGFVEQIPDTIYNGNGRDGSAETDMVADFAQNDIDFRLGQNFYGTSIYAKYVHILHTEEGIRKWLGGMTAIDQGNYRFNVDIIRINIDNVSSTEIWQLDNVRVFNSDESRPVRHVTSGGGGIDMQWRSQVYTVVVSTSAGVITGDISQVPTAAQNAAAVLAAAATTPIQADVKRVNGISIYGTGTEENPWGPGA